MLFSALFAMEHSTLIFSKHLALGEKQNYGEGAFFLFFGAITTPFGEHWPALDIHTFI